MLIQGLAALAILGVIATAGTRVVFAVALMLLLVGDFPGFEETVVPVASRVAAVSLMAILGLRRTAGHDGAGARSRALIGFILLQSVMLFTTAFVHEEAHTLMASLAGLVMALIVAYGAGRISPATTYLSVAQNCLGALAWASLALAVVAPDIAILGGRLRGATPNPNLLGFYAFLCVVIALGWRLRSLSNVVSVLGALAALVGTASRAAGLAVAFALALTLIFSRSSRKAALAALVGSLSVIYVARDVVFGDAGLFRGTASRDTTLAITQDVLGAHPIWGVGMEGLPDLVASSPLTALAAGGWVGGALFVASVASLVLACRKSSVAVWILIATCVLHSFLEAWMVGLTGSMMMVFIAICAVALEPTLHLRGGVGQRGGEDKRDVGDSHAGYPQGAEVQRGTL